VYQIVFSNNTYNSNTLGEMGNEYKTMETRFLIKKRLRLCSSKMNEVSICPKRMDILGTPFTDGHTMRSTWDGETGLVKWQSWELGCSSTAEWQDGRSFARPSRPWQPLECLRALEGCG